MRVRGVAYEHGVLLYELQFNDSIIIRTHEQIERLAANLTRSHPLWLIGQPPSAMDPEGPTSKAIWLERMRNRMDRWLKHLIVKGVCLEDDPIWTLFKQPGGGDLIAATAQPKEEKRVKQVSSLLPLEMVERVERRLEDRKRALQDAIQHFNEALEATVDLQQSQQRIAQLWLQLADAHQVPLPSHSLQLNLPATIAQQRLMVEAQQLVDWQEQQLEYSQTALRTWIQGPGEVLLQQSEDRAAQDYLYALLREGQEAEEAKRQLEQAEQRLLHERSQPHPTTALIARREAELRQGKEDWDKKREAMTARLQSFTPEMHSWWITQSMDLAEAFQAEVEAIIALDKQKSKVG